jgi:hypothetical protein
MSMTKKQIAGKTLGIVTGISAVTHLWGAGKNLVSATRDIGQDAINAASGNTENQTLKDQKAAIRAGTDPSCDGVPSKYLAHNLKTNMICHGNDFGQCLHDAFDEKELADMQKHHRMVRRIQSYGSILIYIIAVGMAVKSGHLVALFTIFPAIYILSRALRRGCLEQTLIHAKSFGIMDYITQTGPVGLWK